MAEPGPKPLPRADRFWARVRKTRKCWIWTGAINKRRGGYGAFYDDPGHGARLRRAHRVAYELSRGISLADSDEVVRHTCDNPPCVRPGHLRLGSQATNLGDMRSRGRDSEPPHTRGEERHNARLTESVVREARAAHAGGATFSGLARHYGVSRHCITAAIKGESWTHL